MANATFHIRPPNTGTMALSQAILIYRGNASPRGVYATVHEIGRDGTAATILAGRPATRHAVLQLSRALHGVHVQTMLIPEQALYSDGETLLWWIRPCARHVAFNTGEAVIGQRGGVVPHPALVFLASRSAWHVWAMKRHRRPTLSTPLYRAPYFNVDPQGAICRGNVVLPQDVNYGAIGAWEDAFFRSTFTHPDAGQAGHLVAYEGGAHAFWRAMLDQSLTSFPSKVLVPAGCRLSDVLPR